MSTSSPLSVRSINSVGVVASTAGTELQHDGTSGKRQQRQVTPTTQLMDTLDSHSKTTNAIPLGDEAPKGQSPSQSRWGPLKVSKRDSVSSLQAFSEVTSLPSGGSPSRKTSKSFQKLQHGSLVSNSIFKQATASPLTDSTGSPTMKKNLYANLKIGEKMATAATPPRKTTLHERKVSNENTPLGFDIEPSGYPGPNPGPSTPTRDSSLLAPVSGQSLGNPSSVERLVPESQGSRSSLRSPQRLRGPRALNPENKDPSVSSDQDLVSMLNYSDPLVHFGTNLGALTPDSKRRKTVTFRDSPEIKTFERDFSLGKVSITPPSTVKQSLADRVISESPDVPSPMVSDCTPSPGLDVSPDYFEDCNSVAMHINAEQSGQAKTDECIQEGARDIDPKLTRPADQHFFSMDHIDICTTTQTSMTRLEQDTPCVAQSIVLNHDDGHDPLNSCEVVPDTIEDGPIRRNSVRRQGKRLPMVPSLQSSNVAALEEQIAALVMEGPSLRQEGTETDHDCTRTIDVEVEAQSFSMDTASAPEIPQVPVDDDGWGILETGLSYEALQKFSDETGTGDMPSSRAPQASEAAGLASLALMNARSYASTTRLGQRSASGDSNISTCTLDSATGMPIRRRTLSTGNVNGDTAAEDATPDKVAATPESQQLSQVLIDMPRKVSELAFGKQVQNAMDRICESRSKTYASNERAEVILASVEPGADNKDLTERTERGGMLDAPMHWRAIRRPSDMKQYHENMQQSRTAASPYARDNGRLFVQLASVAITGLPEAKQPTAFSLVLDNQKDAVTTPWFSYGKEVKIGSEFELLPLKDLQFSISLRMRLDPHLKTSQARKQSGEGGHERKASNASSRPSSTTKSMLKNILASPKKKRQLGERSHSSSPSIATQWAPSSTADLAGLVQNDPLLAHIDPIDGTFAQTLVHFSHIRERCKGRTLSLFLPASAVNGTIQAGKPVAKIELKAFFIPDMPGLDLMVLPESIDECTRAMEQASRPEATVLEGSMSQLGADVKSWRRRCFRLIGSSLVAYIDWSRPRARIDLAHVKEIVVDDKVPESGWTDASPRECSLTFAVEHSFRLVFDDGSEIGFFSDSNEERDRWTSAIAEVVQTKPLPNDRVAWAHLALEQRK